MAFLLRENQKQVYFEDYASSYGDTDEAILLVHGWGMGLRMWDYTLGALVHAGHRVVALDHRGCGKSDKDFSDMGIAAISADVVALVEHLDLRKVVLNGWSLGGAVVVDAADKLGGRCAGLVLTCGATPCYFAERRIPPWRNRRGARGDAGGYVSRPGEFSGGTIRRCMRLRGEPNNR